MKRYVHASEDLFAMTNVLGKFIKVEKNVPFSFYYSPKSEVMAHGPRVKPILNPNMMRTSDVGTLKLCDDWAFVPGKQDEHPSAKSIHNMKRFFRKYLVMVLLVWDQLVPDPLLGLYLEGRASLQEFIQSLDFYDEFKEGLDNISDVQELEQFCRDNDLVNFYGN